MQPVVIYSSDWCPYCIRAKQLLTHKGVAFNEIKVDGKPDVRAEMTRKARQTSVPQIWIGDTHVGVADPDLRHRGLARLAGHFSTHIRFAINLDLVKGHAFVRQQLFGADAVRAPIAGIDDDRLHLTSPMAGCRHASWQSRRTAWQR